MQQAIPVTREDYGYIKTFPFKLEMERAQFDVLKQMLKTNDRDAESHASSALLLAHSSLTLGSYFEMPAFIRDSDQVQKSLRREDGTPVDGIVGYTLMISPMTRAMDVISVWTDADSMRRWYTSGVHGKMMQAALSKQKYPSSKGNRSKRFQICVTDLPEEGDAAATRELWERVLAGKLEEYPVQRHSST